MTDEPGLIRAIHRAVARAQSAGLDSDGQTQMAIKAVMVIRPDLTASMAKAVVDRVSAPLALRVNGEESQ